MVDGAKVGDFLRCCGLNPTQAMVLGNGGTKKLGEKIMKMSVGPILYTNFRMILESCFFIANDNLVIFRQNNDLEAE